MDRPRYYIRDHDGTIHPTDDAAAFGRMFQDEDRIDIDSTEVGDVFVATMFTGIDCSVCRSGPPLLFETIVFGGPLDGVQRRYPSEGQAQVGHLEIVEQVREKLGISHTTENPA